MSYARLLTIKIRPGRKEEAIEIIDDFGKQPAEGFEGMLVLLPTDDPDRVTFITLWDSERSMLNSQRDVVPKAVELLGDLVIGKAEIRNHQVREMRTQRALVRA